MKEFCRTKDLKELLPVNMSITVLERRTGISARVWHKVITEETSFTEEKTADKLLTAIGVPHLYHQLEFVELSPQRELNGHGINAYKKGCRCSYCRFSNASTKKRYRHKRAKMRA